MVAVSCQNFGGEEMRRVIPAVAGDWLSLCLRSAEDAASLLRKLLASAAKDRLQSLRYIALCGTEAWMALLDYHGTCRATTLGKGPASNPEVIAPGPRLDGQA